jgi:hypothetical protein
MLDALRYWCLCTHPAPWYKYKVYQVSSIVLVHVPGMISVLSRISNTGSTIHMTEVEMI